VSVPSSELGPPPPPPLPQWEWVCIPPEPKEGRTHSPADEGVGSHNSDYWRKKPSTFCRWISGCALNTQLSGTYISSRYSNCYPVPDQTVCTSIYIAYMYMWNMYNRLIVWNHLILAWILGSFFLIYFGSGFESGFESGSETGSEMFISVPDRIRIRPKVSDPYGSGSGSATLTQISYFFHITYPQAHYLQSWIYCFKDTVNLVLKFYFVTLFQSAQLLYEKLDGSRSGAGSWSRTSY
jgi:hypothetical protein